MWMTGEVELPDEVLTAHAEGRLVFFVGAGVSVDRPSGLPLFGALAQKLAHRARVRYDEHIAIDQFLGSMPENFDTHWHARDIVTRDDSKPNSTHAALVQLASASGSLRIVTTNFDDHLASAAINDDIVIADKWIGPALPLGDDFEGLIHLHGSVMRHPRELVLTDKDFGRAYLTAAWATRFLLPMFQKFTVLFIGYSHDDPIMRYLALGLPSGTPRFALTSADSAHDVKWQRLGVQPVPYPVSSGDHGALVRALEAWDARVRMGRIEHSARIEEITAAGTILTPVDRDYLVDRLRTYDGVREFAQATVKLSNDLKIEWLRWLENFEGFKHLFDSEDVSQASAGLGNWFCYTFLADSELHGAALQTAQRLGQKFAKPLFETASFAAEKLALTDPVAAGRWRALLATSVHGFTAPPCSEGLVPLISGTEPPEPLSMSVLRFVIRPFLVLKQRRFVFDADTPLAIPDAEVSWNCDEDPLTSNLAAAVQAFPPGDQSLGRVLEDALASAYDLLDAYYGEIGWDPLSFGRSAIETHQQDGFREPIDAIIDALRDFGVGAYTTQRDLPEKWWRTGRELFQRIALHLVAVSPDLDANAKIEWLLERSTLYEYGLKHETYAVLAAAIADVSKDVQERVLEVASVVPDISLDIPDRDRHMEYSKYNLLVWLATYAPAWAEVRATLEVVQQANQDFAPRTHPDFDRWMSSGSWGGRLPEDPLEFTAAIRADAPRALANLLSRDFSERVFNEPSWDDALALLRQTVKNDALLGDVLWNEVLAQVSDESRRADMLRAIVAGWTNADLGSAALMAVQRTSTLVSDARAADQVGRFLFEQMRERVDDVDDESLKHMRTLAQTLWSAHGSTFRHAVGAEVMSTAPLYLNSWPGSLALYWLIEIDRRWRQNREDWAGLNEEEQESVMQLLAGPPHALDATRPAFASQLFFLFTADADFTSSHVLPLFNDADSAALVWHAFLHYPRSDDRLLAAGLLEAMVAEWDRLESLRDGTIQQQFLGVVVSVVSFAGITSEERQQLLDKSVLSEGGDYAERFAETTVRFIRDHQVDGVVIWDRWLSAHLQNRLTGIPRIAKPEELARWADLIPYLGTAIPTGISMFGQSPPGLCEKFLVRDFPEGVLTAYGAELVEFFVERIRNTVPRGFGLSYRIRRLAEAIQQELGEVAVEPLLAAARAKGLSDDGLL